MSSRTKVIIAVVVLVVIGGVVAAIALAGGGPATKVDVSTAQEEDLAVTVTASGQVESGVRMDVFPPTAGTLESVSITDGDTVKAGTVIAQMDTAQLELAVKQAETGVAQAEAQLAGIDKQEPTSADLAAARAGAEAAWSGYQSALTAADSISSQAPTQADVNAASAAKSAAYLSYTLAKAAYDGLVQLAGTPPAPSMEASITTAEIAKDQAYAAYQQAKSAEAKLLSYNDSPAKAQASAAADQAYAGYLSARAQQSKLEGTSLSAERAGAQAAVDQARLALVTAQDTLDKATITAPIDGVVLFNALGTPAADGRIPTAAKGSSVSPASAPFTIVQLEGVRFNAEVDEVDVQKVELGMKATVSLDSFPEQSFESTVAKIMPAATLTTTGGTVFPVHLSLSSTDAKILIGMKGDATIEIDKVPGAVTIPVEGLFDEGGTQFVYLVQGDTLKRTQVEVGTLTETRAEIVSGVKSGDTVALSGPTELVDGMKIQAVQAAN